VFARKIRAREAVVAVMAVMIASAAAQSARAGDSLRPDPSPAATASGFRPDPAPTARSAGSTATSGEARHEVTRAVTPRIATTPRAIATTPRVATPAASTRPTRPRAVIRSRTHSRAAASRRAARAAGAAFAAALRHSRIPLPAAQPGDTGSSSAREPLFAAAAGLAAVVLASGSLLALTSRRRFDEALARR
jgi:hypothetical protein